MKTYLFDKTKYTTAVFDLDGTVLCDGHMSDENRIAISQLRSLGITTSIGSGRSYNQILPNIRNVFDYTIVCNGGHIVNNITGKTVFSAPFSLKQIQFVNDTIRLNSGYMFCFLSDWMLGTVNALDLVHKNLSVGEQSCYRTHGENTNVVLCENILEWVRSNNDYPFKLQGLFTSPESCNTASKALSAASEFTVLDVGNNVLEITLDGISKASALKIIDNPENIIAFGDGVNDIEMLKTSGFSVAMCNGDSFVKEIADYIAPDVSVSGVALAIKDLFDL